MFEERNLLYFEEYYFENGDPAKPKYFLVLKHDANGVMLISLPSSKVNVAVPNDRNHGCINIPEKILDVIFSKIKFLLQNVVLVFHSTPLFMLIG